MLEWVWRKGNPLALLVGMKTVQLLWRRVWRFPKKLGIELPYNSAYKGLYSQSYGFTSSHIWMWELDNIKGWEPKNWCFWTVVLEKTLRVPWTAKRSNQSILKEISPVYSLEGLMLKPKLWYFGRLMWGVDSLEKNLMSQKIEGRRRRGQQRMRWLDGITDSIRHEFE